MLKKVAYIVLLFSMTLSTVSIFSSEASAQTVTSTFVNASFTERVMEDGSVVEVPNKITLQNSNGNTTTFNVDESTVYSINNSPTTIHGFKKGMAVEATINLRKITQLRGTSEVKQEAIVKNSKEKAGIVTKIDPKGKFITVKIDKGKEEEFYINQHTDFIKGSSTVDLSSLYEGDRVRLKFSIYNTSVLSEVEMIVEGIQIERIYRGEIQSVNTSVNRLTVRNGHPFENWFFGRLQTRDLSTYTFEHTTPIYVGNKKITKNELRNYQKSTVYFVTVMEFSKEVIKKIVVLDENERSYYGLLKKVDLGSKFIQLDKRTVKDYYHEGTIIVRNGRLVEPSSLTTFNEVDGKKINGTAHILTDGNTTDHYVNVIHVISDSFYAHNLVETHDLFFGKLSSVTGYELDLSNVVRLNDWTAQSNMTLSYSNSTDAKINIRSGTGPMLLLPQMDFSDPKLLGYYGYFYVKNGHIHAVHFLEKGEPRADNHFKGMIESIDVSAETFDVINVSKNISNTWHKAGWLEHHNLSKALIIKDGKVIDIEDLRPSDQVVIYSYGNLNGHVVIVN